jgi:hypothetical protein
MQSLILTLLGAFSFFLSALAAPLERATACNGSPELCNRIYSNITFIGTHDSAFIGSLPTQNQNLAIADQLAQGIRFLQSQTHKMNIGSITLAPQMCHTNCLLEDGGSVQSYLQKIKTFLDANPNEVVTLLWTNPDSMPMSTFASIFKSTGADKYAFVPATSPNPLPMNQWPTLGDMIAKGQRLVVFIGENACCVSESWTG